MKKLPIVLLAVLMIFVSFNAAGQTNRALKTLSGKVLDETGDPLVGASVFIAGTTTGTVADLDGNYSLKISKDKAVSVTFSFIGMKTEVVSIPAATTQYNIVLKSDNSLDAAVVSSGYGIVQRRENLTGSVTEVTADMIEKLPAKRVDKLLEGLVAGLEVNDAGTTVRSRYQIRLRGEGSLSASREPLWIVDGVPMYTGSITGSIPGINYDISPMSLINPADIESISVLKDAGSTAIYGADGANGVILITTKKGTAETLSVNASMKYGISRLDRSTVLRTLNGPQYLQLALEGWVNAGYSASTFPYQDNEYNSYSTTDTDWLDIYAGTGVTKQVSLSIRNGSKNYRNLFSSAWYNEKSVFMGNDMSRYNIMDRMTYKFNDKLKADIKFDASFVDSDTFSVSVSNIIENLPIFSPYNDDGSYRYYNYYNKDTDAYNVLPYPFHDNDIPERDLNQCNVTSLSGDLNATVTYEVFKGLELTSVTGFSGLTMYERDYSSRKTVSYVTGTSDLKGYSSRQGSFTYDLLENLRANYNAFFGKHRITAMAGVEWKDELRGNLQATALGFSNDYVKEIEYSVQGNRSGSSTAAHTRSLSYLTMAVYTFDKKYTVSASYRRQGYSSFSTYSQWGDFASIGLNWNAYAEPWVRSFIDPYITNLNVKVSYGNNGNSRVDTSSSYGTYSVGESSYYSGNPGATQGSAANPNLSWEKATILNGGLSFDVLKRLSVNIDAYYKYTYDVLYNGRVSTIITDGKVTRNVGAISNKGVEFDTKADIIDHKDFGWTMRLNGAFNSNMIEKLYEDTYSGFFDSIWVEGASKNAHWLVRWAGVDPINGDPLWYDKNGNLTNTFTYENRVLLPQYSNKPTVYGGFTETFRYKNWTLDMRFNYKIGGWTYESRNNDGSSILDYNYPVEAMDHWRNPGDISKNPKWMVDNYRYTNTASTRDIYRMTSVQLSNVSLQYQIPEKYLKMAGVKSASVSLIADNPYFWTPGQKSGKNSYKTVAYANGLIRSFSAELSVAF